MVDSLLKSFAMVGIVDNSSSYTKFWHDRLIHILKEDAELSSGHRQKLRKPADCILNRIEEPVLTELIGSEAKGLVMAL